MVERSTRVAVYGNSLYMAGIAASLKAEAGLEVVCVNPHSTAARQKLSELNPAVIAFDLCDPSPGLDITLWRERPGLLLIGVDPSSNELLVLAGHPSQGLSMADLVNVIHRKTQIQHDTGGVNETHLQAPVSNPAARVRLHPGSRAIRRIRPSAHT